jgi:hypothetical protein
MAGGAIPDAEIQLSLPLSAIVENQLQRGYVWYVSDFVNYCKRSVNLPSGCKDLADVLAKKFPSLATTASVGESHTPDSNPKLEKFSALGTYVSQAWESSAPSFDLSVSPGRPVEWNREARLHFTFARLPGGERVASFRVLMGTEDEAALRAFLKRFGYSIPDSSVPAHFIANQPVDVICDISPIPDDAGMLTVLITEVFRQVCRLNDDSEITVYYREHAL